MKIIAVSAVTGGGKTTVVNEARFLLKRAAALYFDAYSFDGEVENYPKWQAEGADVNVWDLSPMKAEIDQLLQSGKYEYLLLDYPFAYQHKMLRDYLDCCIRYGIKVFQYSLPYCPEQLSACFYGSLVSCCIYSISKTTYYHYIFCNSAY